MSEIERQRQTDKQTKKEKSNRHEILLLDPVREVPVGTGVRSCIGEWGRKIPLKLHG